MNQIDTAIKVVEYMSVGVVLFIAVWAVLALVELVTGQEL